MGTLNLFDERSSRIHPNDRVNLMITFPKKHDRENRRITRSAISRAAKRGTPIVVDSSDEEADDSEDDYDDQDEEAGGDEVTSRRTKAAEPTRRSTRTAAVDHKIR